ncbi:MAG: excalibur calcium-binding domain-containing protein, partial [Micrococcales bacterium]|nr:excalibur calcium-binding domain-containing protein [Micrococcales bacterium]
AIDFTAGMDTSAEVQIDHVVALSDAWQKGAQQLSEQQRLVFANDPLNLLAVDGPTNQSKGDGDAATWLPPNRSYWCPYVARQVDVKAKYDLWVTQPEHDRMAEVLRDCEGESSSDSGSGSDQSSTRAPAESAPQPAQEPAPAPAAPGGAFANCSEARAAGAAPLHRGMPGYAPRMDGDGDGVACE